MVPPRTCRDSGIHFRQEPIETSAAQHMLMRRMHITICIQARRFMGVPPSPDDGAMIAPAPAAVNGMHCICYVFPPPRGCRLRGRRENDPGIEKIGKT